MPLDKGINVLLLPVGETRTEILDRLFDQALWRHRRQAAIEYRFGTEI